MRNYKSKLKIIAGVLTALIITFLLTKTIFISDTPQTNTQFIAGIPARTIHFLSQLFIKPTPTIVFTSIPTASTIPLPAVHSTIPAKRPTPNPTKSPTKIVLPTLTLFVQTPTPYKIPKVIPIQPVGNGQLSSSKLGVFILSDYSNGAKKIVASGPRIIKVMDPQSNQGMMNAMKEYKSAYPNGVILARFYFEASGYDLNTNPVDAAENLFNSYINPQIKKLGDSLRYVDYIETPNESDVAQTWETITKTQWNAQFWTRLTDLYSQAGTKICAGSIAVTNIGDNSYGGIGQFIAELVPMLREIKRVGGSWCYHGYTLQYTTDINEEIWTSLRYRVFYDYLQKNAGDVADVPMIISETGVDKTGDPKTSGWQPRGSQQQFESWLSWYDQQIQQDPYIIGATIFQIGDSNWSSFNVEPISGWLTDYIKTH